MLGKEGHKQTEVGMIPRDWNVCQLGELMSLLTDYDANGSFASLAENVKPVDKESFAWYVRATDLENNTPISQLRHVDESAYKFLKKTSLFGGELLFLKKGDVGRVYLFKMKTKYATVADNLYLLKLNKRSSSVYLFNFFKSKNGQTQIQSKVAASSIPALYKDDVNSILVPLPPTLVEQKAIAMALSDADALITSLDKLIAKKKAIKQGAMQQLLTGKTRLPGFGGKRLIKLLNEICDVRDGTHDSPRYYDAGVKFITSKNIINGKLDFNDIKYISENDAYEINKRSKVDKGDILMSMIGTIGNAVLLDSDPDFCIKNVALLKPYTTKVNSTFLIQMMSSSIYQSYIKGKLDGGIQKFISLGALRNLEVELPNNPKEQLVIATILSDMDAEIEALEKKKAKYQRIKQGMMQELLTGKTRLV